MNVAIIGYGKMGREIEKILLERGHSVGLVIDVGNSADLCAEKVKNIDVAMEFTSPDTAFDNIARCLELGVPVLSGSTGWVSRKAEADELCRRKESAFFYSSNYSIGVNIMFRLNRCLAKMMAAEPQYSVGIEEIHHIHKLDAPSGTAVTLANDIALSSGGKLTVAKEEIKSVREGEIPGIHTVSYTSPDDVLSITHSAKSRRGLAYGAVMAAEWLVGRKGVFGMDDFLKF